MMVLGHVPAPHACVRGSPVVGGAYRSSYSRLFCSTQSNSFTLRSLPTGIHIRDGLPDIVAAGTAGIWEHSAVRGCRQAFHLGTRHIVPKGGAAVR